MNAHLGKADIIKENILFLMQKLAAEYVDKGADHIKNDHGINTDSCKNKDQNKMDNRAALLKDRIFQFVGNSSLVVYQTVKQIIMCSVKSHINDLRKPKNVIKYISAKKTIN